MEHQNFPNYFQAADSISISSQKKYLLVLKTDLIAMILAAALAVYNYQSTDAKLLLNVVTGISLLIGLILTIVLRTKKYEDIWYQGRALAESCKTITWRFITCAEYFENGLDDKEAKERFVKRIKDLAGEFSELNSNLSATILNKPIITDKMMELRSFDLQHRKKHYLENRIEDQKEWYSTKAESNRISYNSWFIGIIGLQVLSIICIVYLIVEPESTWNLIGLLTTLSASAISWLQIKQHQELKQAYTTATTELNFIQELSGSINTEEELSQFILDSENAISREHTLWLAQRRK